MQCFYYYTIIIILKVNLSLPSFIFSKVILANRASVIHILKTLNAEGNRDEENSKEQAEK